MNVRFWSRFLAFLLVALAAFWFTVANASERVTVDFVVFRLSTSLPLLVFGAMLIGMVAIIVVGLRADLQTRRSLERLREVGGESRFSAPSARSGDAQPSGAQPSDAQPSGAQPSDAQPSGDTEGVGGPTPVP